MQQFVTMINFYSMQVYYVWYKGYPYPIREVKSNSIIVKLCNNGFKCRSGLQCAYAHCEEELSYWRGRFASLFSFIWYTCFFIECVWCNIMFSDRADPSVLPPFEVCKDCRWECCLTLFQCQCWTHTHSAVVEVVVHKDELEKDLVEIRCPRNYLGMRSKKYQCNHTLDECRHHPIYACGFPHTEVEQRIWNIWKGTASANASNITAVS